MSKLPEKDQDKKVKTTKKDTKKEVSLEDYYDNLTVLRCGGDKCRFHAHLGFGFHCVDCYEDLAEIERVPIKLCKLNSKEPTTVNCRGDKCRLDGSSGIFCESCFGPYNEYEA